MQGLYLSKQCLVELRCISKSFPCPGEIGAIEAAVVNNPENTEAHESSSEATIGEKSNGVKYAECGCLLRQPPPGRPSVFPIPCSDKNIEEMKKWLVNRYAASRFNKCTHQSLPFIKDKPMKLHVDKMQRP